MNLLEFEIFKTGTHTASNGNTKTFEPSDLQTIASNYNPQHNEAPIVLGHPWNDDAPAYGWIKKLKLSDDQETLIAEGELSDELVDLVKEKKYKKRSISLGSDHNLLHVGFLGAATPAVKGLADINFSQNKDEHSEFEFCDSIPSVVDPEANSNLEEDSVSEAASNFEELSSSLITKIDFLKSEIEKQSSEFSQFVSKDELQSLLTQFTSLKSEVESSEFDSFLNDKIANGNLTPAMKEQIISFCKEISSMNFSEENFSVHFTSFIKNFISSFPQLNLFEEFATKPEGGNKKDDSFNGLFLDPQSYAMHKQALEICESEKIAYSEAIHKLLNN